MVKQKNLYITNYNILTCPSSKTNCDDDCMSGMCTGLLLFYYTSLYVSWIGQLVFHFADF